MIYWQECGSQARNFLINVTLQILTKINPFYSNITIHEWEDLSDQSDTVLWKLLTDKNARESNNRDQTDSDDDIESNDKFKEKVQLKNKFMMLMDQTYVPVKLLI